MNKEAEPTVNKDECPKSQRVDGKLHSWKFDGDDPYVICVYCGETRDALTGKTVQATHPLSNEAELSNCHNAPVKLVGGTGDFSDHEEGITMHYECASCGEPCDLAPLPPLQDHNGDVNEMVLPPLQDGKIDKLLHDFAGCGFPHPDYMFCEWCSKLPEVKSALSEIVERIIGAPEKETWYNKDLITEEQKAKELPIRYRNKLRAKQRQALKEYLKGEKGSI